VLAIGAIAMLYLGLLGGLLPLVIGLPDAVRIAVGAALIFPLGGNGNAVSLALARVARSAEQLVPWAGENACASVVGAIAATLAAIHFGFNAALMAAIALYAVAAVSAPHEAAG
jgi:hypothetical protein